VVPDEDVQESRTGAMVYLRLEIACDRENCHDTMCNEGKNPGKNDTSESSSLD
jgi:hypothetical protein